MTCPGDYLDDLLPDPPDDDGDDDLEGPHLWIRGVWRPIEDVTATI